MDDAAALIEPLAADKRVRFSVIRLDAPLDIRTDPRKARQVLVNLLSNAVKFTDADGAVTLRAQRAGDTLELTITDTGIGIEPDHLDRIFDPFWQVEQKATRRAGGTGLGLSDRAGWRGSSVATYSCRVSPGAGVRSPSCCPREHYPRIRLPLRHQPCVRRPVQHQRDRVPRPAPGRSPSRAL